jgi:hypothetical protein
VGDYGSDGPASGSRIFQSNEDIESERRAWIDPEDHPMMDHNLHNGIKNSRSRHPRGIRQPEKEEKVVPIDENAAGANLCMICCYSYAKQDMFHLSTCSHEYCKNCMSDHLKIKVTDGQVVKIGCMDFNCAQLFTQEDIKRFGSADIYKKYLRFKENIDVEVNPNLKWCP